MLLRRCDGPRPGDLAAHRRFRKCGSAGAMKIVGVKVLEFRRRLDGRSWNPRFRWHERRAPLLILETDSGLTGVGEAWSRQPRIALVLDHLAGHCAPALLGRDPLPRTQICAQLESAAAAASEPWVAAAAASAIDIALWDLAAQAAGQPLWRALGGSSGTSYCGRRDRHRRCRARALVEPWGRTTTRSSPRKPV